MGLAIINSAAKHDDLEIGSVWVRDPETAADLSTPSGALISSDLDHVVDHADVVIDFSLPEATDSVNAGPADIVALDPAGLRPQHEPGRCRAHGSGQARR
jgi:hypothetical protein